MEGGRAMLDLYIKFEYNFLILIIGLGFILGLAFGTVKSIETKKQYVLSIILLAGMLATLMFSYYNSKQLVFSSIDHFREVNPDLIKQYIGFLENSSGKIFFNAFIIFHTTLHMLIFTIIMRFTSVWAKMGLKGVKEAMKQNKQVTE